MIGLDTNVLVRYIMQDDPEQARLAVRFLSTLTPENPGHISSVVFAETTWVLVRVYGATRAELERAIDALLAIKALVVEHADCATSALAVFRTTNVDFADAFIAAIDQKAGCVSTVTFDKRAAAQAGMRLLG